MGVGAACAVCRAKPPRTAEPNRRACHVCYDELADLLDVLDDRLPLLPSLLVPGGQPSSVRVSRDGSPAPLRVDVLALLHEDGNLGVLAVLRPYADIIAMAVERVAPGSVDPITYLREHLDRVVCAPWLEAFAGTLRRLTDELRRVLGEAPHPVATCRREVATRPLYNDAGELVFDEHGEVVLVSIECRGTITASTHADTAVCQRCGDVWERSQWQRLGRLQEAIT
jgi:hypothetical protein